MWKLCSSPGSAFSGSIPTPQRDMASLDTRRELSRSDRVGVGMSVSPPYDDREPEWSSELPLDRVTGTARRLCASGDLWLPLDVDKGELRGEADREQSESNGLSSIDSDRCRSIEDGNIGGDEGPWSGIVMEIAEVSIVIVGARCLCALCA
jgi:hypothetical protein